jgi:hypothetical protein
MFIFTLALYLIYQYFPDSQLPRMDNVTDRLVFTLQCHLLTFSVLAHGLHASENVVYNWTQT